MPIDRSLDIFNYVNMTFFCRSRDPFYELVSELLAPVGKKVSPALAYFAAGLRVYSSEGGNKMTEQVTLRANRFPNVRRRGERAIVGSLLLLIWTVPGPLLGSAEEEPVEIRLISSDPEGIVLEITTGPIRWSAAEAPAVGFDRVTIAGAGESRAVGAPRVPVVGTLVAVPAGAEAEIEVLEIDAGVVVGGILLEPVAQPFAEEDADGTLVPALRFAIDSELYARDAEFPPVVAELGAKGRLRDQEVVPLRVYPARYNPVGGTLRHHARIRVGIRFVLPPGFQAPAPRLSSPVFDRLLERLLINPPTASPRGSVAPLQAPMEVASGFGPRLELGVEVDGFYQVSGAELQAAGLDIGSVDPRNLRLLEGGEEIAIRVVGEEDGSLDPGDTVEFFGRGMKTEYTRRNVYFLEEDIGAGLRMSERDVTPSGLAPVQTTHATTVHAEDGNSEYWQAMPNGDGLDHYFWQRLFSPSMNPFAVTLPNVTSTAAAAGIRVALHGRTDPPQHPDHHTKVIVNGNIVDEQLWDGQIPFVHSASFSQSLLSAGANTVAIELVDDLNVTDESLYLNFIEIDYTADLVAIDDALRFVGDGSGATEYQLSGFTASDIELYDVTDPFGVVRCVGGVTQGGELAFEDDTSSPREVFAVAASAKRSPVSIELDAPSDLHNTGNGADYLVISHESFLDRMTPLLDLRAEQGLRTFAVNVADVYDEFSFGVFDPTAIRDFIQYAYESWQSPAPTFVVLVGDANQDYLDNRGFGAPDYLPTHLYETQSFGQFPEDNFYAAVSGNDILPDVLLGRVSVRTPAQAEAVVAKIVSYEESAPALAWNQDVLHVADDGEIFAAVQDALAATYLLPPLTTSRVYLDDFASIAAARAALFGEIDEGTVMASYLGHGFIDNWAFENLLLSADVSSLVNLGKYPFVITLNCINGYYPHPDPQYPFSLAETLLNADSIGASAVWSPTGLGFLSEYVGIAIELYENLFTQGETRVGAAAVGAVTAAYGNLTASIDNVREMVLFGDPATRLALNRDTDDVLDRDDNCPTDFNPGQEDGDGDGVGDVCDPDSFIFIDGFEAGDTSAWSG